MERTDTREGIGPAVVCHAHVAHLGMSALMPDTWLNVAVARCTRYGFSDPDMVASHQTARGAFIRLRTKFDEGLFKPRE